MIFQCDETVTCAVNFDSVDDDDNFDVTMGAYDGTEECEYIGIFMLSLLSKHINKNHIGLYRDDGLAILKNTGGSEAVKLKKKFQNYLKKKIRHYCSI